MSLAAILGAAVGVPALLGAGLALFTRHTARRVEAYLPPCGRFVDVDGACLHVRDEGSGPALLLVHGLAGQMCHYTYGVVERLAGDHRVVAVDRPGSGYSSRDAAAPADLATQARALAQLIDKLGLDKPVVVGHSLGGAVALTLALEHPGKVAGLALIAPLTHAPEGVPAAFRALTIRSSAARKLFAWTLAIPGSIAKSAEVLGQVFGPEPVPKDFATRGGGLLSLRPGQFLGACADLQALPDTMPVLESRYGEIRVPVQVLYGRADRILDWQANGQALVDKLPGAQLHLADGGHMLPVTQPQLTADFIRAAARPATLAQRAV